MLASYCSFSYSSQISFTEYFIMKSFVQKSGKNSTVDAHLPTIQTLPWAPHFFITAVCLSACLSHLSGPAANPCFSCMFQSGLQIEHTFSLVTLLEVSICLRFFLVLILRWRLHVVAWAFTVLCGDLGPVHARTQQSPLGTWAGPRPQRQLRLLFSGRVQALLLWTSGKGSLYVSGFSCLSVLGGAVVWAYVLLRSVSLCGHTAWYPLSCGWTPGVFSLFSCCE